MSPETPIAPKCQLCGMETGDLVEHYVGDVALEVCRDWRDCADRLDARKAVVS